MRILAVILLSTFVPWGAANPAPLPDLSWLAGDWRRCVDGEIVEER